MATRVTPTELDADNSSGSLLLAARNDWRSSDADSMSARATQSPLQMPDIRLQAQPYPPTLSISFLLSLEGSPYTATLGTHMATGRDVQLTRQIGEYLAA